MRKIASAEQRSFLKQLPESGYECIGCTRTAESSDKGNFQYLFGVIRIDEVLRLELNDSAPNADGDRLRPIGRAQFFHDVFDMDFNCFF